MASATRWGDGISGAASRTAAIGIPIRGIVATVALAFTTTGAAGAAEVESALSEPAGPDAAVGADACLEAVRDCCCPGWTRYAIFDALFLQRSNQAGNQPLVMNLDTGAPALTTQNLQPSVGTGARAFYGALMTERLGWEIGYTGVYGMFGAATATGAANLEMAPPLGPAISSLNPNFADTARATWLSNLNMAEVNVFRYDCGPECGRCGPNCHCIDWLVGFVWAGLAEQAGLATFCCDPPDPTKYDVRTNTNYFGPQVGMRGRRQWDRWAVEGWWKTALCGTSAYQAADPIVAEGVVVREAQSATAVGVGFIGSLNATLVYRLTDVWGLRAGYNLIWLTNGALAPTQFDFTDTPASGTGINDNGVLFLHGANLGVEARW